MDHTATDAQRAILAACTHGGDLYNPWCVDCWNKSVKIRQGVRKAQLDAMPRCQVAGCARRGVWRVGHAPVCLLCGKHKTAALQGDRPAPGLEFLGMFGGSGATGAEILARLAGEVRHA